MKLLNWLHFPNSAAVLDLLLKVTLLLVVATWLDFVLRRRSPAIRHWLWFAALSSTLALPIFARFLPRWHALPQQLAVATAHEIPMAFPKPPAPARAAVAPVQRAAVDVKSRRSLPATSADPVVVERSATQVNSARQFREAARTGSD